jgi:hypothetical protein
MIASPKSAPTERLTRKKVIFFKKLLFNPSINTPIRDIRLTIITLPKAYIVTVFICE